MQLNRPFATVTPTIDSDVLAVRATHGATFTTGQIHRVLDDFSEEGIRRVLTRLVVQGVVLADRVGNAFALASSVTLRAGKYHRHTAPFWFSLKPQLTKPDVSTGGSTHSARESTWSGKSFVKSGRKYQS